MSSLLNVEQLPHRELKSASGEKFSLSAVITEKFGFKELFVHHEVIPPGRCASSSHSHSLKEEMVFVIEGAPTAVLNGEEMTLKVGDCVGFLPGPANFHYLENRTAENVRVLVISSNPSGDQAFYE